jgi:hypothetical protein
LFLCTTKSAKAAPAPAPVGTVIPKFPSADELHERNSTYVTAMLTHFQNVVKILAMPDEVTVEVAAAATFQMKVETQGLVSPHIPHPNNVLLHYHIARCSFIHF